MTVVLTDGNEGVAHSRKQLKPQPQMISSCATNIDSPVDVNVEKCPAEDARSNFIIFIFIR